MLQPLVRAALERGPLDELADNAALISTSNWELNPSAEAISNDLQAAARTIGMQSGVLYASVPSEKSVATIHAPADRGASSKSVVFGDGLYDGARRNHFF